MTLQHFVLFLLYFSILIFCALLWVTVNRLYRSSVQQTDCIEYYANLVSSSSDNPRHIWQTINKLIHRKTSSPLPTSTSASALADSLASFFTDKISQLCLSLANSSTSASPHSPSRHWKSQIAHSDMHQPVSGINSLILSVSLASHVSTHLLIHLSAHLYYHHHSHHPSLLHSFTEAQNLPFQQILPSLDFFYLPDCLHDNETGRDLSCSSFYFFVSHVNFLFVPCGGLSWLPVSFLLHVKYTLSYRIVFVGDVEKWICMLQNARNTCRK